MRTPGKKVTILGLGVSGLQSALFLKEKGFEVRVSEQGDSEILSQRARSLKEKSIPVEWGGHSLDFIFPSDWILISPGVSPTSQIYQTVRAKGIPIYSEIEVASWYCPSSKIVAVTGTCGKTTVTTLLARVFEKVGFHAISCGNIGNPWIGEISKIKEDDVVVLEISSFQLQHCFQFRPWVGILLNLSPNHEDWHKDMPEYIHAKLRLFQNQTPQDYAVFRRNDQLRFFPNFAFRARCLYFGENEHRNPNEEVVRLVAGLFGCQAADVDWVLANFEGIEHRLERFLTSHGVTYVNDSKCTTVASLAWALAKFPDEKVILIAGGHPKTRDFHTVRELIARKVKQVILVGEARPVLREAWQGVCPVHEAKDFKSAVEMASERASFHDVVLLSPACASFDMFRSYMERGTVFKKLVRECVVPIDV